MVTTYT